jgi:hypothetical protein
MINDKNDGQRKVKDEHTHTAGYKNPPCVCRIYLRTAVSVVSENRQRTINNSSIHSENNRLVSAN